MARVDHGRLVDIVGLVTLAMGAGLTLAPSRMTAVIGLGDWPTVARTIGLVDVALAPGLLRGRPRWPWTAARAALNVVIASVYVVEARRPVGDPRARAGAVAMMALTCFDGALSVTLRRRSM